MRIGFAIAALVLATASGVQAETRVRPGRWEVTGQLDFEGRELPPGFPLAEPITSIDCISEQEAKQLDGPFPLPEGTSCKMSDYAEDGNRVSFAVKCDEMAMQLDATFHSRDAYSGVVRSHGSDPSQSMTLRFSARRAGDTCSAQELADDEEGAD